jgi:hypothetical protein
MEAAIESNDLDEVRRLSIHLPFNLEYFELAVRTGKLNIVKFFWSKGSYDLLMPSIRLALLAKHYDVVSWLWNRCSFGQDLKIDSTICAEYTFEIEMLLNRLYVPNYDLDTEDEVDSLTVALDNLITNDDDESIKLRVVDFLAKHKIYPHDQAVVSAVEWGQSKLLHRLLSFGYTLPNWNIKFKGVDHDIIKTLETLRDRGQDISKSDVLFIIGPPGIYFNVFNHDRLELFIWLIDHGCPPPTDLDKPSYTSYTALPNFGPKIRKWIKSNIV